VFFNLFIEPEPFAAILIAHGTQVFLAGRLLRPEGPKLEAEGREQGRGQRAPSSPAMGFGGVL